MIDLAQKVRATMFKYGVGNLPLWDTETTWNGYADAVTGLGVAGGDSGPATPMPGKQTGRISHKDVPVGRGGGLRQGLYVRHGP